MNQVAFQGCFSVEALRFENQLICTPFSFELCVIFLNGMVAAEMAFAPEMSSPISKCLLSQLSRSGTIPPSCPMIIVVGRPLFLSNTLGDPPQPANSWVNFFLVSTFCRILVGVVPSNSNTSRPVLPVQLFPMK